MELSKKEYQELNYLRELQQNNTVPIMEIEQNRLRYLKKKEFHNICSNVSCRGYTGFEDETSCPKCKSKLFKLI